MPTVRFDTYYRYKDLTDILQSYAQEYPHLVRLESSGRSYEDRDIWVATVTNFETGEAEHKPAFWVDGNIHASEVSPSSACLYLIDHLVTGSKESRIASTVDSTHVLITGHPYVDVWQSVLPERVGLRAWPSVPRGTPWKAGICAALGRDDEAEAWRRILASVRSYADLEPSMLRAVEELIDFVTSDHVA